MIQNRVEVSVEVIGIKKRCRKTEKHNIKVWEGPDDGVSEFELDDDMKIKVSTAVHRSMKTVSSPIVVRFFPYTIESDGPVQIKRVKIPDPRYKRFTL